MAATDPFDSLRRPLTPRRPQPQFAAALRRRIEEELQMTSVDTSTVHLPRMFHIRVPNADRAMAFFGAVLDWQSERVEWEGHVRHYMTNTSRSVPVLTDEEGAWAVRLGFEVDDVDQAATTIERLGGRITERDAAYALAEDDQGVPLVVWTPGEPHPAAPPTRSATGELEWFEIRVPSADRGKAFYGELLGWNFAQFEGGPYHHVVDAEGASQAGVTEAAAPVQVTPCATVLDIGAARARVVAAGGTVDDGPVPMGPGVGCECSDDQGTRFSLWSPA